MTCTDQKLHVGDFGTKILVTIVDQDDAVVDISGASAIAIVFRKPSGSFSSQSATLETDGTDGKLHYIIEEDFLDEEGVWQYRAEVAFAGVSNHESSTCTVQVAARWTT